MQGGQLGESHGQSKLYSNTNTLSLDHLS